MVHALGHSTRPHPDANRIAGITAAIAFNAALLLLLLVPISAPPSLAIEDVPYRWILPAQKQPVPEKPIPVPVTKTQPQITPTVIQPRTQTPPVIDQTVVDQGTLPADPPIETTPRNTASQPANSVPLPGVRLEYADAPAPSYPRDALREGIEGTVMLQVLVDIDGRPLDVQVQHSSGNRQLDNVARRQVLERWRFRPAMQGGRAVQAIGLVPIAFNLDR
ncbi:MAG TPA: TonB family protein [Luteimonas sp.]|nr:TonB family protein [Luteimonas sp.]